MDISVTNEKYKDIDAIKMESPVLSILIIPESGGKIQSIFHKSWQRELLYQSGHEKFIKARYADPFGMGDVSGFDEIFPSIEECVYPAYPWKGTLVPDHGEVWALPWDYSIEDEVITMSVNGVRFPYRLEKRVEFISDSCFRLSYQAENLSDFNMPFIWSPHPYFLCDKGSRVVLPPSVKKVISTCGLENKLGDYGSVHEWPLTTLSDGSRYDISDVMDPPYAAKCEKFYAVNHPEEGWCALLNAQSGETIGLSYPPEKLPYLGVWEGIINGRYVTAIEPVTGSLDRLDLSFYANMAGVIKRRSVYSWYLNLSFMNTQTIQSIDRQGSFVI